MNGEEANSNAERMPDPEPRPGFEPAQWPRPDSHRVPGSEPEPERAPEPGQASVPEPEPEPESEPDSEPKPKPKPEPQPPSRPAREPASVSRAQAAAWLDEDLGPGDITTQAVIPAGMQASASIIQKAPGVLSGIEAAAQIFAAAGVERFEAVAEEGVWHDDLPVTVATLEGPARALLAGERTALNLLGHLSGVATLTTNFVRAAGSGGATILDTRKTMPGIRSLEKAAVVHGGGQNHRMGLYDEILIKENHVAIAGGIREALARARRAWPDRPIAIECREPREVHEALAAGADRLLLDNMPPARLESVAAARDRAAAGGMKRAELEASGGVGLDDVAEVAATGVDFVSIGALTHSAPALDLSLLFEGT